MYIRVEQSGNKTYPYSVAKLKAEFPHVSFPSQPPEATLNEYGVYSVQPTDRPEFNKLYQKLIENDPVEVNGQWQQSWLVADLSTEEINQKRFNMSITPRQARLMLFRMGLLSSIETFLQGQGNEEALIEWEYATTYNRLSEWVLAVQNQMGWTDVQLDTMFIDGAKI